MDEQENLANLKEVLSQLQKYGVRMQQVKCAFLQNSVEYLGYQINPTGLHATKSKVNMVLGALTPNNVHELHSFLGLLNYGKFILNLATILYPLNCLLKRSQ